MDELNDKHIRDRTLLLDRWMEEQKYSSKEEALDALKHLDAQEVHEQLGKLTDAKEQSRGLVYEGYYKLNESKSEEAEDLGLAALRIDPENVDAYYLLSLQTSDVDMQNSYLQQGLKLGRQQFENEDYLKLAKGQFWYQYPTRPYMRLLFVDAWTRFYKLDHRKNNDPNADSLTKDLFHMLSLHPNDSLGVRFLLRFLLLANDNSKAYEQLKKTYHEDENFSQLFGDTFFYAVTKKQEKAASTLEKAAEYNHHIFVLLSTMPNDLPMPDPFMVYEQHTEAEAFYHLDMLLYLFNKKPTLVDWLDKTSLGTLRKDL